MILYLDDSNLNKYIPLKKLAPYREQKLQSKYNQFIDKKNLFNLQKEFERKKVKLILIIIQ